MSSKKCLDSHVLSQVYNQAIAKTSRVLRKANLCFGVCRTGTTALAQVYGKAGFKSFYQLVKADFRLASDRQVPVNFKKIDNLTANEIFLKETIGPFFSFETEIDFLHWYEMLGICLEQSHFIIAFRDPAGTFASWWKYWGKVRPREKLFDVYIKSELTSVRIEHEILKRGLPVSYYCHHLSQAGLQNFDRLFRSNTPQIPFKPSFLRNWHTTNLSRSKVVFPEEPGFFVREEIHETTPFFNAPPGSYAQFSVFEQFKLIESKVIENYQRRLSLASQS